MSKRVIEIVAVIGSVIGIGALNVLKFYVAISAKNTKKKIDKEVELKLKHVFPNEEKTNHDA